MSEATTTTGCFHEIAVCDGVAECLNCGKRWLDPADPVVRETIARALDAFESDRLASDGSVSLDVGWYLNAADAVLAALASATEGADRG